MAKWIRSDKYSKKNYPMYFHSSYKYALVKEKLPCPHWTLIKKLKDGGYGGIAQWETVEHFLSNIKFNDTKLWFENSQYNKEVD